MGDPNSKALHIRYGKMAKKKPATISQLFLDKQNLLMSFKLLDAKKLSLNIEITTRNATAGKITKEVNFIKTAKDAIRPVKI